MASPGYVRALLGKHRRERAVTGQSVLGFLGPGSALARVKPNKCTWKDLVSRTSDIS